jgi:hypothetical protein
MTSYRYWKIQIDLIGAGTSNQVNLQGVELRATAGGTNLSYTGNGTASATSTDTTYTAAKAFDSDTTTRWLSSGSSPQSVTWDFGAGNEQSILEVALYNGNSTYWAQQFSPYSGKFYCSPDGTNWYLVGAFTGRTNDFSTWTTHVITPPGIVTADISAPLAALVGYLGDTANITAPAATMSAAFGSFANLVAPAATLYTSAHDSTGENAANITAPAATLVGYLGANAHITAPAATLEATATTENWLTAIITAAAATVEATGSVSGMAQANITAPAATLVGYGGMVISVTPTEGATVSASMTAGSVMSADITAPSATLTLFDVTVGSYCSADIIAPAAQMGGSMQAWIIAPGATLTAIGHAVVTATYEAYALNLNHINTDAAVDEVTRYTNFPFTQIVRYQGSYFGVAADGLYLLEGTTDNGDAIPWEFMTTLSDFKSPFLKTVVSAYFGGRMGPAATVHLQPGEDAAKTYSYATTRSDHAQNYRQKFGRGLDSRYFAVGASGTGTLELDNIELNIQKSNRRI